MHYIRGRIPPRYGELSTALESNVRGVLYGAIYSTFLTQGIKSLIILVMNVAFQVPLAARARDHLVHHRILSDRRLVERVRSGGGMAGGIPRRTHVRRWRWSVIGFLVNTVYISTFLRPKIAAERSKVLNFYWMLVALVTGVYTFGLGRHPARPDADRIAQGDPRHDRVGSGVGMVGSRIKSGGDAGRINASEF